MERDYWFTMARDYRGPGRSGIGGPHRGGTGAAASGRGKVETQNVPVIFEPRIARSLLGNLFEAVEGRSIYRDASFLAGNWARRSPARTSP